MSNGMSVLLKPLLKLRRRGFYGEPFNAQEDYRSIGEQRLAKLVYPPSTPRLLLCYPMIHTHKLFHIVSFQSHPSIITNPPIRFSRLFRSIIITRQTYAITTACSSPSPRARSGRVGRTLCACIITFRLVTFGLVAFDAVFDADFVGVFWGWFSQDS
jgi:hypothetical protein